MSTVLWDGDNLIQKAGKNIEQLGHVKYEEASDDYVLWLKDTRNVFGTNTGYIRGDAFRSLEDAKQNATTSTSAFLFHYMWLVGLRDSSKIADKTVAQNLKDYENGRPLTESTFKDEMAKANRKNIVIGIIFTLIGLAGLLL